MTSKFREELVALYTGTANFTIVKVSQHEKKCSRMDRSMFRAQGRQKKHKAAVRGRTKLKNAGQRRANYNHNRLKRQPITESLELLTPKLP
jgi:hypothetical protein